VQTPAGAYLATLGDFALAMGAFPLIENGKLIGLADTDRVAVWHTDTSYRAAPSMGADALATDH